MDRPIVLDLVPPPAPHRNGNGTAPAPPGPRTPPWWRRVPRPVRRAPLLPLSAHVPPGESVEQWTRFVSVQTFAQGKVPWPGARRAMSQCRLLLQGRCPGAAWTVVRDGEQDALYEWRIAGCAEEPDQHEVGRIVRSGGTWARITFSVKGEMDAATRDAWLRRLSDARLVGGMP